MRTIQNKDDYAIVLSYGQLEKPQKIYNVSNNR